MAFTDHKISAFTHKISDLADQPNLPPDELKARFDACPEQLRVSLNAVCDDAAALDTKVSGIVSGSFEGAVDKSMLSADLAAELDAKATQTALEAETASRQSVVNTLTSRINSATSIAMQKAQMYALAYTGNGQTSQTVSVPFTPNCVIIMQYSFRLQTGSDVITGGMMQYGKPIQTGGEIGAEIISSGFRVYQTNRMQFNTDGVVYYFVAFY